MDRQNKLKGELAEALEDGDKEKALAKCTEAILVGNPSAMQLAKRAELLYKMKRAKAAISDATAALQKNPDRGKALRFVGEYDAAKADLDLAQKMDYDDDTTDIHTFVSKANGDDGAQGRAGREEGGGPGRVAPRGLGW